MNTSGYSKQVSRGDGGNSCPRMRENIAINHLAATIANNNEDKCKEREEEKGKRSRIE